MAQSTRIESLDRLISEFQKLPGIGPRSAERVAFHVLKASAEEAMMLAGAIRDVKQRVRNCTVCYNLTERDPCEICRDPRRDAEQIVVVEQPKDVIRLEQTGRIRGRYHVLMGQIAPLEGVEPGDLTIDVLVERVKAGGVREIILALSPTLAGDGTALHVQSALASTDVTIKRPARGLPTGAQLEYANAAMLADALENMQEM